MKKKAKNKENNKLIMVIVAVLLIIAIIGGSTYAYWSWQTATNQQTNVSVTVKGGTLNITGTNVTSTSMRPTTGYEMSRQCSAGCISGDATVTATNETATDMLVTLKLRGTLTSRQGTLNSTNKAYLKWVVEEYDADGEFYLTHTEGTLANVTTNTDFDINHTFTVAANNTPTDSLDGYTTITNGVTTTTRTYSVFVWLDDTYEFTNTGDTVSDPMQDLTLSVKWSPASTMVQQ